MCFGILGCFGGSLRNLADQNAEARRKNNGNIQPAESAGILVGQIS
jgi:hypothetical protein